MINSSHIYEKQSLFFVFLFLQGPVVMLRIIPYNLYGLIYIHRLSLRGQF